MRNIQIKRIKTVSFFYRPDSVKAALWTKKLRSWLRKNRPSVKIVNTKPQALIALGGDGAILEAAKKYQKQNPIILGMNLGRVGFLASVREPRQFIPKFKTFLNGRFKINERLMLNTIVIRKGKEVLNTNSLNDVVIQNMIGVSEIEVMIGRHRIQYIYGSGILVATATGSTAYNLSAHGPIVMPHMKCFIVSELLDHNIPSPSIIIDGSEEIRIKILNFRLGGSAGV